MNISFSTNGTTQRLGNVPTKGECAAAGGGWYYDNPGTPTRIITCPETCAAIQAVTDAKVQVLVGCTTEPATVR